MTVPQTLKGFRDFLPPDAIKRDWLRTKIREIFESWGYDPLETPTLEPFELFAGQIGEDEKLFFQFEDNGGRKVALRYDQTVPACRVVGTYLNTLTLPFKRYQIHPAYRAEKPQKGRFREFLQCDADIFGIASPYADAEVIALSLEVYKQLGFGKAVIKLNDRKLLKDFPYEAIVAIDKLKKIGPDGVIKTMENKGIPLDKAKEYLDTITTLKPNETIDIILKTLKEYGFPEDWYEFDSTIARSFAYSDGPIWEVEIPAYSAGSVLGGERYDSLIKKIAGVDVPATGFAVGFDRTLEALTEAGLTPSTQTLTTVLVTVFDESLASHSLSVAKTLREQGISTELYTLPSAKLDKQLKYADKKQIPYAVIIGPEEKDKNVVVLKSMKTKEQQTIPLSKVAEIVSLK